MSIIVCPLSRAAEIARQREPSHAVSLLDPRTPFPALGFDADRHLRLDVHDVETDFEGVEACSAARMAAIIDFVSQWRAHAPILIHCYAGISRSTATAFITACVHNPDVDEALIARVLREVSPTATPNRRFVALADAALNREGRMCAAVEAIGRGAPCWPQIAEAEPFALPGRFA